MIIRDGIVAGSTVSNVGSASAAGASTTIFARGDHVHIGMGNISLSSASGNTISNPATLILSGGNCITLSGITSPGAMTVSISAQQSVSSATAIQNLCRRGDLGAPADNSSLYLLSPFKVDTQMTVSAMRNLVFFATQDSSAAATVSGALSVTIGLLSADTVHSSWMSMASGSFSVSYSLTSSSVSFSSTALFTGGRTTNIVFPSTYTLSETVMYAVAYSTSVAGSFTTAIAGLFRDQNYFYQSVDTSPWGVTSSSATQNFGFPDGVNPAKVASQTSFLDSLAFTATNLSRTAIQMAPAFVFA